MGSLKDIRQRITSVKSTRQITSAMKMVSAAKLKKAQDAIIQIRPYAARLHQLIGQVTRAAEDDEISPFTLNREPQKVLLVIVSANRGLCGGFNSNVVKAVIDLAFTRYAEQREKGNLFMTMIGKKGGEVLKVKGFGNWPQSNDLLEKPSFVRSEKFANQLMDRFISGEFDRIELIYNQFKNAASQVVMVEQFLPVQPAAAKTDRRTEPYFIFEPGLDYLVTRLIPEALRIQLHKSLLDSQASEHGARMTAMHQATDNATDMIRDLTLEYNKARQAAITSELIEIVSGAEALTT